MSVKYTFPLLMAFVFVVVAQGANAEIFNSRKKPNENVAAQAEVPAQAQVVSLSDLALYNTAYISKKCTGRWEAPACLKQLSSLSMDLVSDYAAQLEAHNKGAWLNDLKQHCSASTAALKVEVPAYAMKSAIIECANIISDIKDATTVNPDLNMYQLFVGSVMCLGKSAICETIESQMSNAISK